MNMNQYIAKIFLKWFGKLWCKWVGSTHSLPYSLSVGSSPVRMDSYRLKCLHIAATLHLEHSASSEIATSLLLTTEARSSLPSPMQTSLRMALESLVGEKTETLRVGVDTIYGWTIGKEAKVADKYTYKILVPYVTAVLHDLHRKQYLIDHFT